MIRTPSAAAVCACACAARWHRIRASMAIVACLLLMVLVEVGSRQLIVGARYFSLRKSTATSPSGSRPLATAGGPAATNLGQE